MHSTLLAVGTPKPVWSHNERYLPKHVLNGPTESWLRYIAYRNDILCTNDRARAAGTSIFDSNNQAWLKSEFGIRFATLEELLGSLAK
jgi:hypothetical protein